jgi:hypothetical protein
MAETDGIEEAAEQLLRTATMTAAQVVEQLARARQQRLRDDASTARDRAKADLYVRRDREGVLRAVERAEGTVGSTDSGRAGGWGVDQVLVADQSLAAAERASFDRYQTDERREQNRTERPAAWDDAGRRTAFATDLDSVADREAVNARLLLERARAHPASASSEPWLTAPAPRPFVQAAAVDPGVEAGR